MFDCPCCSRLSFQSAEPMPAGRERDWYWAIGRHNMVTRMRSRRASFGEHTGPLSLKSIVRGSEAYEADGVRRVVEPGRYLLLNAGQRYRSAIEADDPVEAFCVWFRPRFAEEVLASMTAREDELLADPGTTAGPVIFVDRLYPHDDLVSPVLQRMHREFDAGRCTREWLDEQFYLLMEGMLRSRGRVTSEIDRIPAVRKSTRVETYRRMHRAKDYLESNLTTPVVLSEVASVAWLSPHHFLRQFQQLFGETPRQYQTRRRMEKACDLLLRTDEPVTGICFSLGFESLGSFSWLFRRLHGVPPTQYRAIQRGHSVESVVPDALAVGQG